MPTAAWILATVTCVFLFGGIALGIYLGRPPR